MQTRAESRAALSARMAEALRRRGITPAQMANEMSITPAIPEAWLRGEGTPKPLHLMLWARICGVPFEWLAGVDEQPAASGDEH
jgi:transcriptional regulator with XRE-family HTH domain